MVVFFVIIVFRFFYFVGDLRISVIRNLGLWWGMGVRVLFLGFVFYISYGLGLQLEGVIVRWIRRYLFKLLCVGDIGFGDRFGEFVRRDIVVRFYKRFSVWIVKFLNVCIQTGQFSIVGRKRCVEFLRFGRRLNFIFLFGFFYSGFEFVFVQRMDERMISRFCL